MGVCIEKLQHVLPGTNVFCVTLIRLTLVVTFTVVTNTQLTLPDKHCIIAGKNNGIQVYRRLLSSCCFLYNYIYPERPTVSNNLVDYPLHVCIRII